MLVTIILASSHAWAGPETNQFVVSPVQPFLIPIAHRLDLDNRKSVLTQHNDNARTGAYLAETALTPATVNSSMFGRLYARHVDGQVAAQPLYVHGLVMGGVTKNVLVVATRKNWVYAFDADDLDQNPDKAPLRSWHIVGADGYDAGEVPGMDRRTAGDTRPICGQTHGPVGITSTPVIDPATRTMYLVARMAPPVNGLDGLIQTSYSSRYTIYTIDLASGVLTPRTDITSPAGLSPANTFDPNRELNRPGLLLVKGKLYIAFGGLVCDTGGGDPATQLLTHGWVFAYDTSALTARPYSHTAPVPASAYLNTSYNPDGAVKVSMAGIWQSGQGPAADANGDVYLVTGNNEGADANGTDEWRARGDQIVKLHFGLGNGSSALNFAVSGKYLQRWQLMDRGDPNILMGDGSKTNGDTDIGSGGVVLLPNGTLIAGGKEGRLYVLDRATMTPKMLAAASFGATDGLLAYRNTWHPEIPPEQYVAQQEWGPNIHGSPIVWIDSSRRTRLYAMPEKEFLTSYTLAADGSIDVSSKQQSPIHRSPDGMPGAILSLSANGSTDGIVWATVPKRDALNEIAAGRIIAFDAITLAELWRDDDDIAYAKFTPPTIADGKVFRPTFGGEIVVYGLLHGRAAQVTCNDAAEAYRVYGGAEALGDVVSTTPSGEIDYLLTRYGFDEQKQLKSYPASSAIFYSPSTCGHVVRDDILLAYHGKQSLLGFPITNDEATSTERLKIEFGPGREDKDMQQRFTHFERGSIFYTPRTHAHEIHGPIRDEWARLGWDRGLGFPSTDVIAPGAGLVQHSEFQKFQFEWDAPAESAIYWSQATGAHAIYGDIYNYWKQHQDIGLPLDDEHDGNAPDGRPARISDFQNGSIYWIKGANPPETFSAR